MFENILRMILKKYLRATYKVKVMLIEILLHVDGHNAKDLFMYVDKVSGVRSN